MKPVKTAQTNDVYRGGGGEVDDLPCHVERNYSGEQWLVESYWWPSDEERAILASGGVVKLSVFTPDRLPPMSLEARDEAVAE